MALAKKPVNGMKDILPEEMQILFLPTALRRTIIKCAHQIRTVHSGYFHVKPPLSIRFSADSCSFTPKVVCLIFNIGYFPESMIVC